MFFYFVYSDAQSFFLGRHSLFGFLLGLTEYLKLASNIRNCIDLECKEEIQIFSCFTLKNINTIQCVYMTDIIQWDETLSIG